MSTGIEAAAARYDRAHGLDRPQLFMFRSSMRKYRDDADQPQQVRLADTDRLCGEIAAWCEVCGHHQVLATAPLLARLGPRIPVVEIGRRLVCRRCAGTRVQTRPHFRGLGVVAGHEKLGDDD